MRTVDIGISHNNDLVISEFALIKFIADSCTKCHNYRLELLIRINLIDTSLLNVQHLTPERKDRLILTLSSLLCRSACGVSLYDEDLAELCFVGLTVSKLTGKRVILKYCLPSGKFSCSLCCITRTGCRQALIHDELCNIWMLFKVDLELLRYYILYHGSDLGITELGLRLSLELRIRELN